MDTQGELMIMINGQYMTYDQLRDYGNSLFDKLESLVSSKKQDKHINEVSALIDEVEAYKMPDFTTTDALIEEGNALFDRFDQYFKNKAINEASALINEIQAYEMPNFIDIDVITEDIDILFSRFDKYFKDRKLKAQLAMIDEIMESESIGQEINAFIRYIEGDGSIFDDIDNFIKDTYYPPIIKNRSLEWASLIPPRHLKPQYKSV